MYLDPSFGGMLAQILVAVVVGGGAIAYGFRRKIKMLFKGKKSSVANPTTPLQEKDKGEIIDMMDDNDK